MVLLCADLFCYLHLSYRMTSRKPKSPTPEAQLVKEGLEEVGLTQRELTVILVAVISGMFLATLDTSILNVAIPAIVGDLGGVDQVTWIVASYLVTLTVVTPIYGKLSDIYGRKLTYQVAATIFIVFSGLAGFVTEMWQLVVLRAFQGVGAGGLIALPMVIMGDLIPPRVRGRYMGYLSMSVVLSSVAGPLLGGVLTDQVSWRLIFFINVPFGVASMLMVHYKFNIKMPKMSRSIDGWGVFLLTAALGPGLVALVVGGEEYGWSDWRFIGMLAISALLLVAFVLWERRPEEPLLPLHFFSNSVVSVSLANMFVLGMALFASGLFVPIYLQIVKGASATISGFLTITMSVGMSFAAFTSGRLITRWQKYKGFVVVGMVFIVLGLFLLGTLTRNSPELLVTVYLTVLGFGIGATMPTYSLVIQNAVPYKDLGIASTTMNFIRSVGSAVGAAVFGALFASRISSGLEENIPADSGLSTEQVRGLIGRPDQMRERIQNPEVLDGIVETVIDSVKVIFWAGMGVAVLGFLVCWFLKEIPLRASLRDDDEVSGKAEGASAEDTSAEDTTDNSASDQVGELKETETTPEAVPPV